MSSVLKPWVMDAPWKVQSILLSGLRAPDAPTVYTKRICRWMRALSQHNADPSKGYMEPQILSEQLANTCMDELEYLPCHYVHHFADALAVVVYFCPDAEAAAFAKKVHDLVATEIFHFKPESRAEFIERHQDRGDPHLMPAIVFVPKPKVRRCAVCGYKDSLLWCGFCAKWYCSMCMC